MATKKEQPNEKQQDAARQGAQKVIDHLGATGTGLAKLDVAKEVLKDLGTAGTEEEGAELVVAHLRRSEARGVGAGTVQKAEEFVARGLEPDPAKQEPAFDRNATAPGAVPAPQTGQRPATGSK